MIRKDQIELADRFLSLLGDQIGGGVVLDDAEKRLAVSTAQLRQLIELLGGWGYKVKEADGQLQLVEVGDFVNDFAIRHYLSTKILGQKIHSYQSIGSTNNTAWQLAEQGAPEGTLVVADRQTAGRGRLGRSWHSPPRVGLWFSLVLRPEVAPSEAAGISLLTALALSQAIQSHCRIEAKIKWPNDCQIAGKKVAGILTELSSELDRVNFVIVGVGLNVNQAKSDFPSGLKAKATSLAIETKEKWLRAEILALFLKEFEHFYLQFKKAGIGPFIKEIERRMALLGQKVKLAAGKEIITGKVAGLAEDGALLLETKSGSYRAISGEVSVS
ncbi:MAG TPA: biotin--[acetyl-CoA-carboxylase] ligase [Verrucomicrobiae bacterium]|nr:biotin--[acetyl-CoA-carboxylase] ligase [Verrucomicrobiae bacterium]